MNLGNIIQLLPVTFFASLTMLTAQAPVVTTVIPVATSIEKWEKFEAKIGVTANWTNPYNYDEIRTWAVFVAPDGVSTAVDGFFIQEYSLNTQTGALTPTGTGVFKVRFAPNKTGTWKYTVACTNSSGTGTFVEQTFQVTAITNPDNKGFVRSNSTNYLHLDAGDQLIPVGENIGWQNGNAYVDYTNWLTDLSNQGGNFFRLWHASWGLGIEWNNGTNGYNGLRKYKQTNAFYQDWLFDFCAERGIYIELCLHHHGQVSTQVNPEWSDCPYNQANGGPCANTWDFFTNTTAKNHVKNRLRYVVARWGYARSVMNWELFNEVDWTDQFVQRKADVANWHLEMAAYLKQTDPYHHLVSTSYAQDFNDPALWNQPDIDFTQTHYYINSANLEGALANGSRKYLNDFAKPTLTGEFGLGGSGDQLGVLDPNGIHIHNALWGALFGGGLGSGMTWWWDNYIEPKNLYYHFGPVTKVAAKVPFKTENLAPASASVTGAPADLLLYPSQGWGAQSDTAITINNGTVLPAGAGLGQFLYGAQWNTQLRRPPVFYVTYPSGGTFKVKTGTDAGQSPKVAIWLDGVKVLEQSAVVNQTYSINVPAGSHVLKVDNTGTDWITIAHYNFSGLGSSVDAYVLKSEDSKTIAGWVLSNRYNYANVQTNGTPVAVNGATLLVPGIQNGENTLQYYHCLTGDLISSETVAVNNGTLVLTLPTLLWDLAFIVSSANVSTTAPEKHMDVSLYPNPAPTGGALTLQCEGAPHTVTLLGISGQPLQTWQLESSTAAAQQTFSFLLPIDLPAGFYWLKIQDKLGGATVKGLAVVLP